MNEADIRYYVDGKRASPEAYLATYNEIDGKDHLFIVTYGPDIGPDGIIEEPDDDAENA